MVGKFRGCASILRGHENDAEALAAIILGDMWLSAEFRMVVAANVLKTRSIGKVSKHTGGKIVCHGVTYQIVYTPTLYGPRVQDQLLLHHRKLVLSSNAQIPIPRDNAFRIDNHTVICRVKYFHETVRDPLKFGPRPSQNAILAFSLSTRDITESVKLMLDMNAFVTMGWIDSMPPPIPGCVVVLMESTIKLPQWSVEDGGNNRRSCIVHQTNIGSEPKYDGGVAQQIIAKVEALRPRIGNSGGYNKQYFSANEIQQRWNEIRPIMGKCEIGNNDIRGWHEVINAHGQVHGGPPRGDNTIDSATNRNIWIKQAILDALTRGKHTTYYIPYQIGCAIGGGDWRDMLATILGFATQFPNKRIILTKWSAYS